MRPGAGRGPVRSHREPRPRCALRIPARRLVQAARATGRRRPALSHDAGRYLCNYLCWRATEAAARPDGPKVAAFVHVPKVRATGTRRAPLTFDQLVRAGEAIVLAAIAGARTAPLTATAYGIRRFHSEALALVA